MRRDDAPGHAELVEPRIEVGALVEPGDLPAVDEQAHAARLVPGEGDMLPLRRGRRRRHPPRHAQARQVGVGDEGIEAVAVPVDAQERHVPAGVVGEAGAEDHERRVGDGRAGAPEEGERAALGDHVARRLPRDIALVGPARRAADRAVWRDRHRAAEVGDGIACGLVRGQVPVGGDAEQQAVLCGGGGCEQRGGEREERGRFHRASPAK